jgi:hypothetical protein
MPKRRRILLFGGGVTLAGLVWTGWALWVSLGEMHTTSFHEKTDTLGGVGFALVVIGIIIMIASRFAREDT